MQLLAKQFPLERRTKFQGMNISIENDVGSVRSGIDKHTGKRWSVKMKHPYGYIRMTQGVDGDHVDCFIGPNEDAENAYVIHQNDVHTGSFDEDKVMLGFDSLPEAKKAYLSNYALPEGSRKKLIRSIDTIPIDRFKEKAMATKNNPQRIAAMGEKIYAAIAMHASFSNPGG